MTPRDQSPEARQLTRDDHAFISAKLRNHASTDNGCVLWTGCTSTRGYGRICIRQRTYQAHRLSWLVNRGPIPVGLWVCHHCDVPACIAPEHLFLGSPSDNMRDCAEKRRNGMQRHPERSSLYRLRVTRRGTEQVQAKLRDADAITIRIRYAQGGVSQDALAREYSVSQSTITRIIRRVNWRHVS